MNLDAIRKTLRRVDRGVYPALAGYSDREIWHDLGPGGLYLADTMARQMGLRRGDIVLDLGCGRAETSVFLAKHYGVQVIAVDLWTEATANHDKVARRGVRSQVLPLHLDAREPLPFAEGTFDALFCMNALSFFGGDVASLGRLAAHLKSGGILVAGGEVMSAEFSPEQLLHPPEVYSFVEGIWEDDFCKLHSPPWWRDLFARTPGLEVLSWGELPDGRIYYEDEILNRAPEGYLGLSAQQAEAIELRQIAYGRENEPYMTVHAIVARWDGVKRRLG